MAGIDWLGDGADLGAMLTGLSALTASFVWTRGQLEERRDRRAQKRHRAWSDYVDLTRSFSWYVRLADDPSTPSGTVALHVLATPDGEPDAQLAYSMSVIAEKDGMLSQAPTPEQHAFLLALAKQRRAKGGDPLG